jgi:hypothetical protein
MPTIACPGCGKQYKVQASAAGQVAKCGCGKRFRLAAAPLSAPATVTASAAPAAAVKIKTAVATKATPPKSPATTANDDFWDEALKEETVARPVTTPTPVATAPSARTPTAGSKPQAAVPSKKKKKRKAIRWGFDWGKVAGGALTFLIAGGITVGLVVTTGYLYFWPAGIAIVGFFTMLSGLMGEEGVW